MARETRQAAEVPIVLNHHAKVGNPGSSVAEPGEEVIEKNLMFNYRLRNFLAASNLSESIAFISSNI